MAAVVAVQTDREAPANELSRAALVEQIDTRSDDVRALQAEVARADPLQRRGRQQQHRAPRRQLDDIETRVRRAELTTGFSAVHGPGVRITVDNRPGDDVDGEVLDEDLATLVDGLFEAGAEAVAINDQRINALGRHPQHQPRRPRQRPPGQRALRRLGDRRPAHAAGPARRDLARASSGSAASTTSGSSTRPRMSTTSACRLRPNVSFVM